MAVFRFNGLKPTHESGSADKNPIDSLIDAAGGSPLPGRWGVAQALLEIWSKPLTTHLILWTGKSVLSTAGVYRAYRRSKDPTRTEHREDPIAAYTKAKNLILPEDLNGLGHLIHVYSEHLPREDVLVGGDKRSCIRRFQMPSGLNFFYTFTTYSAEADDYAVRGGWFSGRGPYVEDSPAIIERLRVELAEVLWAREGNADLQLSCVPEEYGPPRFLISNIGSPDDYVSEGAPTIWASVQGLAKRCRAFKNKGLSRKILFFGPPGTGKTTLARNLAREVGNGHTLRIEASAVEEAGTTSVMRFVRLLRPRVILFDDLDRCHKSAEEILHYMERAADVHIAGTTGTWSDGLIVIGTVNAIDEIDPALLRPGRFDEVIEVDEPCDGHREAIIRHYLRKFAVEMDVATLAQTTKGFSPADLREVIACCATVGVDVFEIEMERVRRQRTLFAGKRVEDYLTRSNKHMSED